MLCSLISIAATDPTGGAGLLADVKTASALGVYAGGVVTAVTAQSCRGVEMVESVTADCFRRQLACAFHDLMPAAVKIGLVATVEQIDAIADMLEAEKRDGRSVSVVVDPVMSPTAGGTFNSVGGIMDRMTERLFPLSTLLTPNVDEVGRLLAASGIEAATGSSLDPEALCRLSDHLRIALLAKGGDDPEQSDICRDILIRPGFDALPERFEYFTSPRIRTINSHGTGCVLSSAIAALLARGHALRDAVAEGRRFVGDALKAGASLRLGRSTYGPAFFV